jgi:hypothetical protein
VLQQARTCITGLFVPKSALEACLEESCDICRIKIQLYWYDDGYKKRGKQGKHADMWDENNDNLKDAPLSKIGIIANHYIAYLRKY